MTNAFLEAREARFANFAAHFPHTGLSPLAVAHPIRPDLFAKYRDAVAAYHDMAKQYDFANLTPAGMLMPKRENERLYTEVTARFLDIADSLSVGDLIKGWNIPAIRHKNALTNPEHLKRPFVSEDAHCDAWIGWGADCMLFLTPVLGDTTHNWVRFFGHPRTVDETWIRRLGSFRDGEPFKDQCEVLPKHYQPGYLYIVDIAVIHQTIRDQGADWRVGMEMVGYFVAPPEGSWAHETVFTPDEAAGLRTGRKRYACDLKMGEIADNVGGKRGANLHLVDA